MPRANTGLLEVPAWPPALAFFTRVVNAGLLTSNVSRQMPPWLVIQAQNLYLSLSDLPHTRCAL